MTINEIRGKAPDEFRIIDLRSRPVRLRTLMIGVALVAFMIAFGQIRDRRMLCRHRARNAAIYRKGYLQFEQLHDGRANRLSTLASAEGLGVVQQETIRQEAAFSRAMAEEYHLLAIWAGRMKSRYEEAENHPWRSIPSDLPAPTSAAFPKIRGFSWDEP